MLYEMLELQVALIDTLSSGIISWNSQSNHELLLQSQILQVAVQDSRKVVDRVSFGREVDDDLLDTDVSAHTDLLLHDSFRALLDVRVR